MNTHALSGDRSRDPRSRATADQWLKPQGHRDRLSLIQACIMNSCIKSTYSSLDLSTDLGPAKSLQMISESNFNVFGPKNIQNARNKKPIKKSHKEYYTLLLTKHKHVFGVYKTLYDWRGSDFMKHESNQIHSKKNRVLLIIAIAWEWENRLTNHAVSSQFVGTSSKQCTKTAARERSKSRTSRFRSIVTLLHIVLSQFRYLAVDIRSQQYLSYKPPLVLFLSLLGRSDWAPTHM